MHSNSFLLALSICSLSLITGQIEATVEIAPGVTHEQSVDNDSQQSIHILRVDPEKNLIRLRLTNPKTPAQTTSQICAKYNALAAINGGFFDYNTSYKLQKTIIKLLTAAGYTNYTTKPVFALKIGDAWHSHSAQLTGAIGWQKKGKKCIIDTIKTRIENNSQTRVFNKSNQDVTPEWQDMDYVLGGTPLLVHNNTIIDYTQTRTTPFYVRHYTRTAVGITADGTWLLTVVNKCTIAELAHIMHNLGCTHALNLDGGSSSTMVVNDTVVNDLSSGEFSFLQKERPVSNCITIQSRR